MNSMWPESCNLFWSGGIDSTVLLISMLSQRVAVHPVWVEVNASPAAMEHEHEARERIIAALLPGWRPFLMPERRFAVRDYYRVFTEVRLNLATMGINTVTRIPRQAAQGYIRWNHVALLSIAREIGPTVSGICQQQQISRMPEERRVAEERGLLMPIADWTKFQVLDEAARLGTLEMLRETWSCPAPTPDGPCRRPICIWCADRAKLDQRLVERETKSV